MDDDVATEDPKRSGPPRDDAGAVDDSGASVDEDRHYLRDPEGILESRRDADERAQDDLLELDQTELEELGLVLDDPHQPEPE